MSTGPDNKHQASPEVRTFGMPEPPPPPPEEPEDRAPKKASASQWVILFFLSLLAILACSWVFFLQPKLEAERAAAEAAANYVRPWPERTEEAIRATFEGEAGDQLAASIVEILEPEGAGAKLQGLEISPAQENVVALFRLSWNKPAPKAGAEPTLATASVQWTNSPVKHVDVALVGTEEAAADETKDKELEKLFGNQVRPIVRKNTEEK